MRLRCLRWGRGGEIGDGEEGERGRLTLFKSWSNAEPARGRVIPTARCFDPIGSLKPDNGRTAEAYVRSRGQTVKRCAGGFRPTWTLVFCVRGHLSPSLKFRSGQDQMFNAENSFGRGWARRKVLKDLVGDLVVAPLTSAGELKGVQHHDTRSKHLRSFETEIFFSPCSSMIPR